jgi:hypothetical protein
VFIWPPGARPCRPLSRRFVARALAPVLSTQVPRLDTIAVPSRAPSNPRSVHLVSRAASTRRRDERLRPSEAAVFEVSRDWDALVEIPQANAIDRLKNFAETGAIRVDRPVGLRSPNPHGFVNNSAIFSALSVEPMTPRQFDHPGASPFAIASRWLRRHHCISRLRRVWTCPSLNS